MEITSMLFLLCFLPVSLIIYYVTGDKAKEGVLLGISLFFYAVGSLRYFLLFTAVVIITVALGRQIHKAEEKRIRKLLFIAAICINVVILCYYKYTDFAIITLNQLFDSDIGVRNLLLPMGISFFTFKAISYLSDVYLERIDLSDISPVHDALYLSFFAQIQSGPLTRYSGSFQVEKEKRLDLFSDGVYRFLIGFNKKILLANTLNNITSEVFSNSIENLSTPYIWLGSICYSLQLFFDFAGYSDMAIGISEMFGYRCMENFDYPYITDSVSRFWRRWHISLSQWFRDYIYIPLGGSRCEKRSKIYRNLFIVWILTGIWHGANWNFVFWGFCYFLLIAFERATGLPDKISSKVLKFIYRLLTLLFINCQWVMFRADDLRTGLQYLKRMFIPASNDITEKRTVIMIREYFVFIFAALLFSLPVIPWLEKKLEGKKWAKRIVDTIFGLAIIFLFVWAMSFVIAGQNNPFTYADF